MKRGVDLHSGMLGWVLPILCVLLMLVAGRALAQEPGNAPEIESQKAAGQPSSEQQDKSKPEHPGFGAQLAKETREAAGEDDEAAQFKQSASVRWLSKFTGGNLQHAYWLAMLLNFGAIARCVSVGRAQVSAGSVPGADDGDPEGDGRRAARQ